MNGTRIFSGGYDKKVTEWTAPLSTLPADASKEKIFYSILKPASKWEPASEPMVPVFDSNVQQPAPAQMALKVAVPSLRSLRWNMIRSHLLILMCSLLRLHKGVHFLMLRYISPPQC